MNSCSISRKESFLTIGPKKERIESNAVLIVGHFLESIKPAIHAEETPYRTDNLHARLTNESI